MGSSLTAQLQRIARRMIAVNLFTSIAWGLLLFAVVMLVAAWLDLLWEFDARWRAALPWLAAVLSVVLIALLTSRSMRRSGLARVARLLDQTGQTGGAILSGWELQRVAGSAPPQTLTAALSSLAVADATSRAQRIAPGEAVSLRPAAKAWRNLAALSVMIVLVVLVAPGLARTQWQRFAHPWDDVPPFSRCEFQITPGDTDVLFGDPLDIYAEIRGEPVDQATLVLTYDEHQENLPMFHEVDGRWRAVLAKVTQPAAYHVEANRARSHRHRIGVITVPRITEVRIEVTPPEYAQGRGAYRGELPTAGVSGLRNTRVKVTATSNRRLSGGTITVEYQDHVHEFSMQSGSSPDDTVTVSGEFLIAASGKFSLRVKDIAGQLSREAVASGITLIDDQRPFVRLLQPRRVSLATPSTNVPVEIAAEDDYGVSRLQLFRSLNDSRAMPLEIDVTGPPPRLLHNSIYLPLSAFGLSPGDKIALFARVEDNDPAGAKGAESPLHLVHIIAQDEFERMLRARQGLDVLLSKYRAAQRRLEALKQEAEELQKELEADPQNAQLRERLEKLAAQLERDATALATAAKQALPYDADASLTPQLEKLSSELNAAADKLAQLLKQRPTQEQLKQALEQLAAQLGGNQQQLQAQAMLPLEHLEKVFPLMADQSRFVILVQKQRDLAERLRSLKGRDNEDSPALKSRMRDLEEEQRALRAELDELLSDIENHVQMLPDVPETEQLRESALAFVAAVRQSNVAEEMAAAELGLAEFSGTRGFEHALQAAEILESFLSQCNGVAGAASACLGFKPSIGQCLGQTASQLLAEMGLNMGQGGFGSGTGGGGYSARRGPGQDVGLYGNLPGLDSSGQGMEMARQSAGSGGTGESGSSSAGTNPDAPSLSELLNTHGVTGAGAATVPLQYRERVGQYFQRISEALD